MPVEFDSYTPDQGRLDLSEGTNARAILTLLLEHPGVGFTPAEIHEETGIPKGSVNPTLGRLERAGTRPTQGTVLGGGRRRANRRRECRGARRPSGR